MQKLTEILVGLVLIVVLRKHGYSEAFQDINHLKKEKPFIVFMDPLDFKKKSCLDGYVHDVDYFILTGFINITNKRNPFRQAGTGVWFLDYGGWMWVHGTNQALRETTCRDQLQVAPNRCICLFHDDKEIRVKCNVTMHFNYFRTIFRLNYVQDDFYYSDISEQLPYVYGNTSCMKWVIHSKNQGCSLVGGNSAMSGKPRAEIAHISLCVNPYNKGMAIIFTALVFTASSLFSYDQ